MTKTILITCPDNALKERAYIYSVLLYEFLGLDYEISYQSDLKSKIMLSVKGVLGPQLIIDDSFFHAKYDIGFNLEVLPQTPLSIFQLQNTGLPVSNLLLSVPVMYGQKRADGTFYNITNNIIDLGLDIFGSSFFMLTRYEERLKHAPDQYGRFLSTSSLAYQENFLIRPIVNEYLEILWACLKQLWPSLQRKDRSFQFELTHDVDEPFTYLFSSPSRLLRRMGRHVLDGNLRAAITQPMKCMLTKCGDISADPAYTFPYIMDMSERYNLVSTFYFICHRTKKMGGDYDLFHPRIRSLLKSIAQRSHKVGLHASYSSYNNRDQLKKEFKALLKVCKQENIYQKSWGSRQHYLRWKTPLTFSILDDAGLDYDSTLSFVDHIGFRCGTCYEYPIFDLQSKQKLNLKERPLIVMDGTLLDPRYMWLSREKAYEKVVNLKNICRKYNGRFVLLWHNSQLLNVKDRMLYESILQA